MASAHSQKEEELQVNVCLRDLDTATHKVSLYQKLSVSGTWAQIPTRCLFTKTVCLRDLDTATHMVSLYQ